VCRYLCRDPSSYSLLHPALLHPSHAYTVDNAGNRTAKSDLYAGVTTSYGYDAIYELLNATQAGATTESYTYDPVGNRLSSIAGSGWSYNSSNELNSQPSASYTYDANGNTTSKTDSTGTTTYSWDYDNRLTSVTLPGSGGTVSYRYDPFGRRIEKISPTATSIFAYDNDNLIETVNASGGVVARYTQGLNIDEPLAELRATTTDFYEADAVGSVTSLTDTTGALAQTYTFDSFGNTVASTGTLRNYFQYTGREFDTETNLYFYRARYFDPQAGRFLSEDPIGFEGGINFYAYTRNSPINFKDPQGWEPAGCTDCKGNPTQGLDAGKKCCSNTAPMSSSTNPVPYSPCDTYMFINAGEMYRHGGDGSWGQLVRGCLVCMMSHGATPHQAHMFCYWNSAKRVSTPWNLGLPALGGLGRAVGGAVAILPKEFLPVSTGGPFPTFIYFPCMATK